MVCIVIGVFMVRVSNPSVTQAAEIQPERGFQPAAVSNHAKMFVKESVKAVQGAKNCQKIEMGFFWPNFILSRMVC